MSNAVAWLESLKRVGNEGKKASRTHRNVLFALQIAIQYCIVSRN